MSIIEIRNLDINGVFEITLTAFIDNRGFFMRAYDVNIMKNLGIHRDWVQENHSKTQKKHTIRGLHLQLPPYSETKLVRCIRGKILDVFVDLRKDSHTFGQWGAVELTEDNFKIVFIPRGFAHGFCTLIDDCEVLYKVDNHYSPEHEIGIIWNDETLNINWPTIKPIVSEKDSKNITFDEFKRKHKWIDDTQ